MDSTAISTDWAARQRGGAARADSRVLHAVRPLPPVQARFVNVTLLFSDMVDSVGQVERLGDVEAHSVLRTHHAIVRKEAAAHGGREVDNPGDAFLLAFPTPEPALHCAIAIQRELARYNRVRSDRQISVRMGLHGGRAIEERGKYFGKTVVLAARIASRAKSAEVLVSEGLREQLGPAGPFDFDDLREYNLKGLKGIHRACLVRW